MNKSETPVVRRVAWPLIIPQFLTVIILTVVAYLLLRPPSWQIPILISCGLYLLYSYGSRLLLIKPHREGIRLFNQRKYKEAISKFEESYRFFSTHEWIDRYRSLTLMTPAAMGFREMALINLAACYFLLGNTAKAKTYYQQALVEFPDSQMAKTALRQLEMVEAKSKADKTARQQAKD
jgi:tetratricopeptide (TPR) repeat protein